MSIGLATKGVIGGLSGGGGGQPYPVPVEEVEVDIDGIEGPFVDVATDVFPTTPSPDGSSIVPSAIKAEGMARIKPRFNVFPTF